MLYFVEMSEQAASRTECYRVVKNSRLYTQKNGNKSHDILRKSPPPKKIRVNRSK